MGEYPKFVWLCNRAGHKGFGSTPAMEDTPVAVIELSRGNRSFMDSRDLKERLQTGEPCYERAFSELMTAIVENKDLGKPYGNVYHFRPTELRPTEPTRRSNFWPRVLAKIIPHKKGNLPEQTGP